MRTEIDDITIRPARAADIPALCGLLEELFALEGAFSPDLEKQVRGLSMLINDASGASIVLVAEGGGQVLGMASVQSLVSTAEGGRVGLVEDVVVDNRYRQKGIGRGLLDAAERWARERRLRRLQLLADSGNSAALRFYECTGWLPTGMVCLRKMI